MRKIANCTMTPAIPDEKEALLAPETSRQLEKMLKNKSEYRFQILHDAQAGEVFTIPASAMHLLVRILAELGQGNAVTVTTVQTEVSTQEAMDLLNYKRTIYEKRHAILNELTAYDQELGLQ